MLNRLIALAIASPWIRRVLLWIHFREAVNFVLRRRPLMRRVPNSEGLVYRVNALDNLLVAREIFAQGEYSRLRSMPDIRTFVDLGCNCGYFPLFLASFVQPDQLHGLCIDANPQMVEDARWQFEANGLWGIRAIWGLVGAVGPEAKAAFFVNPDAAGSSQFDMTPTGHLSRHKLARIEVPVLDLQALWRESFGDARCDVLKIDIEGSEGHFLEHEFAFVERCRYVVIEIHSWKVKPDEVQRRLEGAGLRLVEVIGNEQDAEVHLYERQGQLVVGATAASQ